MSSFASVQELAAALDTADYLIDDGLATALFLAQTLGQPLLLEGEPGVGKTAAAKAMAAALDTPLLRLQCYEGIAASEALYEWNYPRQLLSIRLAEAEGRTIRDTDLFAEEYLVARPLLAALRHEGSPPVVLIDEIDRADDEFEALLFEFLGECSITIPELGTIRSVHAPIVVLTSNRSRELHDALKRRCLYHWIDYPDVARAARIVRRNVPDADAALIDAATAFVTGARTGLDLDKPPGLAETIDWVSALTVLGVSTIESDAERTLGSLAKTPDDRALLEAELAS